MQSSEIRPIVSLAVLYNIRMIGPFIILPVLTLAGNDYSGSSVFLLGVALGIFGLTQALLQIPFGLLSDRFGRKPLIAIGLALFAIGSVTAAVAESVEGLILGRALQGTGAVAGVLMAMVADLTSEQSRTKAMAAIGASIGVAFALSMVLGPLIVSVGGVRSIFWTCLALSIIGSLILLFAVPTVPVQRSKRLLVVDDLSIVLTHIPLLRLNVGIYCLHTVLMALLVALPLLLESIGFAQRQHAWIYLAVMAAAFALTVPLIIVGERRQRLKTIFLSVLLMAVAALVSLAFATAVAKVLLIFAAMLVFFTGFCYLEATLPSLMTKTVPSNQRGAGSGLFSTCQFLGIATGGIMGGWLFDHHGIKVLLLVCALIMFCWWLLALTMKTPKPAATTGTDVVA